MKLEQIADFEILRPRNTFTVEQVRGGEVIFAEEIFNAVTASGINSILNTYFGADAKKAAWYLGLVNSTGFTSVAEGDTMASHAGWTEFQTYDETTRQLWTPTTSTDKSVTGTGVQIFTVGTVSAQSIQGLFVTDSIAKGGTSGLLWATALFSAPAAVLTGDTFRVTYTLRLGN